MARLAFNDVTRASHELSRRLGPFQLLEQLGEGGMAVVYRARRDSQTGLGRDVVLKTMLPQLTRNRALVQMFEAEARLTAQLRHPNIVCVEDFGVENDTPYIAMEYLDGKNLSELRTTLKKQRRQMPIGAAVAIARDLCRALGYAHDFMGNDGQRVQVIHRDVSPSNVMLQRDGTVKLLDFGVAKLSAIAGEAVTTSLKGKFAYMSPEQVEQKPIDRRCDVFAAGIVLHEMLTGERLFGTRDERETLRRVAAAQAHPPSARNQHVGAALDAVVLRALSREREGRFDSGVEMARALDALGIAASRRELSAFLDSATPEERPTERQIVAVRPTGESFADGATDQDTAVPATSPGNLVSAPKLQIIAGDEATPFSEITAPSVVYSGEIEIVEPAVRAAVNESADRLTAPAISVVVAEDGIEAPSAPQTCTLKAVKLSSNRTAPFVGANAFEELPATGVEPAPAPRGRRGLVLLIGVGLGVIAAFVTVRVRAHQRLQAAHAAHAPAKMPPPVVATAPAPVAIPRRETELAAPVSAQPKLPGLTATADPGTATHSHHGGGNAVPTSVRDGRIVDPFES